MNAIQATWLTLDSAIIGIGAITSDDKLYIEEVCDDPVLIENRDNIRGDILSHLFLKDGGELEFSNYQHIACPLETVKKIPTVIAIARGVEKADIIYYVARNKYISTLLTDEETAKEILFLYDKPVI